MRDLDPETWQATARLVFAYEQVIQAVEIKLAGLPGRRRETLGQRATRLEWERLLIDARRLYESHMRQLCLIDDTDEAVKPERSEPAGQA